MKTKIRNLIIISLALVFSANIAMAHSHTHVGINQDGIDGTADDNKLFFFSMPGTTGFPNWGEPLELVYQESGLLAGKYVCEELYCWHSAHPENGAWQLGGTDPNVEPAWDIALERVSVSNGFRMLDYDTLAPVLTADGNTYDLCAEKEFDANLYNENGELGAWSFHAHMYFVADANGIGQTFSATFKAKDLGLTGYSDSDEYTINFITVPEPISLSMLALGGVAMVRRRFGH